MPSFHILSTEEFEELMGLLTSTHTHVVDIKHMLEVFEKEATMSQAEMEAALAQLQDEVQHNGEVVASAVTLINGIAAQLEAAADDPVAVQALVANLKGSTDALAAAVAANTPAAEQPVVAPPVESP